MAKAIMVQGTMSNSGKTFVTGNPATGKELAHIASCGKEDVDRAVAVARKTFESGVWSKMHPTERKKIFLRLCSLMEKHMVELAVLESLDSGKPIRENLCTDLPETIECLEWHAEYTDKQYGSISPSGDLKRGLVVREPAGVVACVLPWNFRCKWLAGNSDLLFQKAIASSSNPPA